MKTKLSKLFALMIVATMLVSPVAAQSPVGPKSPTESGYQIDASSSDGALEVINVDAKVIGEVKGATGLATYLVMLSDAPLANYKGDIAGLAATNPAARGENKLDAESADSRNYIDFLNEERAEAITGINQTLGRKLHVTYEYVAAMNGFAAEMTPAEAALVAKSPDVLLVQKDQEFELHTDAGPAWIGAPGIWDGTDTGGLSGTYGEGVIVGVIDTGIDPWNPSFADLGGDGYDHTNPWGSGTYKGVCDSADPTYDATFPCNDKLIGAWGYDTVNGGDPRDANGHGSHTASTSAGNFVYNTAITTTEVFTADISGVAPHANIVMYAACCTGAALTAARDQVILDGVDVVNYSIGSSSPTADPWGDAYALQWKAVRNAGIFVATSAGNAGPGDETLNSPGDAPWMTTIGASSHNRAYLTSLTADDGVNAPIVLNGQSMAGGLPTPAEIVFSSVYTAGGTIDAEDARLCADGIFPAGTFSGEIVVCERGTYGRVAKGQTVLDGGAGGYILAQPTEVGGGPGAIAQDSHVLPAVHIDYYTYQNLLAYMAAATGPVMGTISDVSLNHSAQNADVMASFSSRGPNGSSKLLDIVKPNVTAPGRAIWAAYHQGDGGDGDYTYNIIQGTSMSSPHVAGAGALLVALHPDWTPAQIESAMMTTAETNVLNDDGTNLATPFAQGSGRVELMYAGQAGLVLDVTDAEFTAADPAAGGDPKTLNIASFGDSQCLQGCEWTRVVSSTLAASVDWTAVITAPAGMTVTVTPSNFTLGAGAEQTITVTADVSGLPVDVWAFAQFALEPSTASVPTARFPIAVKPTAGVFPLLVETETRRNAGSIVVEDLQSIEITDLTVDAFGLVAQTVHQFALPQVPDNGMAFPDIFFQPDVYNVELTVPVGSPRLVAEIIETTSPDLDMLVMYDANDNGIPEISDVDENACQSASGGSMEACDIADPVAGRWFVMVLNWSESSAPPDPVTMYTAVVPATDSGNMTLTGPTSVPAKDPYDLTLFWDIPGMMAGDRYYGAFSLGTDAGNAGNIATIPVSIHRVEDDVIKSANTDEAVPGDIVTYTITVNPNVTAVELDYMLTDRIPSGLTYVPGSVDASSGTANAVVNTVTWEGAATSAVPGLVDLGFVGYYDISGFTSTYDLCFDLVINSCDEATVNLTGMDFDYLGVNYDNATISSNGFMVPGGYSSDGFMWLNQDMPDPAIPNNTLAPWWTDLDLDGAAADDPGAGHWYLNFGVTDGTDTWTVIQWDGAQLYGDPASTYTFQIWITAGSDDIYFSYDTFVGDTSVATVGIENVDGTMGAMTYYDGAGVLPSNDLLAGLVPAPPISISYATTVDADATLGSVLTNFTEHQTDNPGSKVATTGFDLHIGLRTFFPLIFK